MRHGSGHAHGNHGWHGTGGAARRSVPQRRSAGAGWPNRGHRPGQDRHDHGGQASRDGSWSWLRCSDQIVAASSASSETDDLLRLAASVERGSEHPLGVAIWHEANARGLDLSEPSGFVRGAWQRRRGRGQGTAGGGGKLRMMQSRGIALSGLEARGQPPAIRSQDGDARRCGWQGRRGHRRSGSGQGGIRGSRP